MDFVCVSPNELEAQLLASSNQGNLVRALRLNCIFEITSYLLVLFTDCSVADCKGPQEQIEIVAVVLGHFIIPAISVLATNLPEVGLLDLAPDFVH